MRLGPVRTPIYELRKPDPVGWVSSCGSPLPHDARWVDEIHSPTAFCEYCGSELDWDQKKCPNCGGPRRRPGQR